MNNNEIILFETEDRMISLPVMVKNETVWLNRNQLSELFERDIKTIGKHINNALKEELSGQKYSCRKIDILVGYNSVCIILTLLKQLHI